MTYDSYENALEVLNMETLSKRRDKLLMKFAKNAVKHPKYNHWFELSVPSSTRTCKPTYKPVLTRTDKL